MLSRAYCLWLVVGLCVLPAQARYGGGLGTAAEPYLISTAAHLNAIGAEPGDWDKCFKLTADIDLRDLGATPFRRIGTLHGGAFAGVFDGNYKTISNLRLYSEDESYLALFGIVDAAEARIFNVTLRDPDVAGDGGRYVAALVGLLSNGTIANCHVRGATIRGTSLVGGLIASRVRGAVVTDCTAAGTVRGSSRVGGLIGGNLLGDIVRCQAAGAVWGDASSWSIGGLIGENESGTITVCRACSTVEGNDSVGGLIGNNITAAVSGCGAEGMVQGHANAGGLIGQHAGGKITDCYAVAGVVGTKAAGGLVGYLGPSCGCQQYIPGFVARSYAAGPVTGTDAGGLAAASYRSSVEASFWDIEATGCTTSAGGEGRTTAQMYRRATYVNAGWALAAKGQTVTASVWCLPASKGYPRLASERTEADFNGDGRMDLRDFALVAKRWRQADTGSWSGNRYVAPDGIVDFDDLAHWTDLWLAHRW
ncbi:MAG: hypothetical protein M1376_08310 [Planctomycetes bacterium]|nr:hypothetical protein [Planctomycetota bacterium]